MVVVKYHVQDLLVIERVYLATFVIHHEGKEGRNSHMIQKTQGSASYCLAPYNMLGQL